MLKISKSGQIYTSPSSLQELLSELTMHLVRVQTDKTYTSCPSQTDKTSKSCPCQTDKTCWSCILNSPLPPSPPPFKKQSLFGGWGVENFKANALCPSSLHLARNSRSNYLAALNPPKCLSCPSKDRQDQCVLSVPDGQDL